jgi:1-acyl-sn-glycerol-3-phosphate acyltransferase
MLKRLFDLIYAPLAALMLALALLPVCLAVILGPTPAIRRETGRLGVRFLLACMGTGLRVRGLQHLPEEPCIVISNHVSYFDGLVMTAALPRRFTFVVKDDAAAWPLVGLTLKRMGVEFVQRSNPRAAAKMTRMLIRRLGGGESFTIFAEGTFKPDPGLLSFKNGAFVIAARAGVPVVPAAIRGTRRLYGGHNRLPRWSLVEVELRPPLRAEDSEQAAARLRDATRAEVLKICGEPDRLRAPAADGADML